MRVLEGVTNAELAGQIGTDANVVSGSRNGRAIARQESVERTTKGSDMPSDSDHPSGLFVLWGEGIEKKGFSTLSRIVALAVLHGQ